jgi:hypothetical protein
MTVAIAHNIALLTQDQQADARRAAREAAVIRIRILR